MKKMDHILSPFSPMGAICKRYTQEARFHGSSVPRVVPAITSRNLLLSGISKTNILDYHISVANGGKQNHGHLRTIGLGKSLKKCFKILEIDCIQCTRIPR